MPKYPNIVGTGFPNFIQDQINIRSSIIGSTSRDGEKLSYLNNRTGWFRMTSAAIVNGNDDLAKNNILQGGIVSRNDNNTINLKKDFIERYTKGNDDDLGLKPIPGITNLNIGTGGKWQTIQEAEVQFTCYNLDQLDTLSKLYMSLGVQVFIEYGHLPYYNNSNKLISKVDTINFFDINQNPKGRESLIKQITKKEEDTDGNYGALLGYVFNFNYTANPDGTYTCSTKVIGPGHLAESLTINNNTGFYLFNEKEGSQTESKDNKSDFEHIISKLIKFARDSSVRSSTQYLSTTINENITNFSFTKPDSLIGKDNILGNNISYSALLNTIYQGSNNCSKGLKVNFDEDSFKIIDDNLKYGNATQIINGLSETDDLKPIGLGNDNSNPHFFDLFQIYSGTQYNNKNYSYITLGHLFFLLQNFGIIVSEEGNISDPTLKLDFHPDNTIIKSGIIQATINPFVCVLPLKVIPPKGENEKTTWTNFFGGVVVNKNTNETANKTRTVLNAIGRATGNLFTVAISKLWSKEKNLEKNFVNTPSLNKLNPIIDYIDTNDENNNIKLFNVLVNLGMVLDVFTFLSNQRDDKKVFLIPFLDKILEKISASLGGINNLRISVDEKNHILRVVDEHRLKTFNNTEDLITIPTFGKDSVALNYNYSAQITPNLAKQIVVAAQAINNEGQDVEGGLKAFPDEILSYNYLNGGVTDRFIDIYNTGNSNNDDKIIDIWTGKYQKLFDHLTDIYRLKFNNDNVDVTSIDFTKAYIDRQQIRKNFDPKKAATILMPLGLTLRLDGISGIRPYNAFKIPDNRLPIRYRGKIAFIVYSINHIFENNKWFTELVGQTIYLDEEEKMSDNTTITETDKNPPQLITPEDGAKELINAAYPQLPDSYSGAENKPQTGKATPTEEDEQENNIINPPESGTNNNLPEQQSGGKLLENAPGFGTPTFSSTGNDIIGATELIKNNEVPNGRPLLTAYKDTDYTTSSGFTYRIGFGSDTITSSDGSVRKVQKGDTITESMAIADLNRRITQEFRPKVIQACQKNGVFYPSLPDCVKSVFIDIAYNYGTLWNSFVVSYRDQGKEGLINELKGRAERGPSQVPSRRYSEIEFLQNRC